MLSVGYTWQHTVAVATPATKCSAYADNWSWSTSKVKTHPAILKATCLVTNIFGMSVDWHKTWAWVTHKSSLTSLKNALLQFLDPDQIHELCTNMDLGCQMQYRGPPKIGKLKKRIEEAQRRLKRIQTLHLPFDVKQLLVTNGVYSVAMYGFELTPMGIQKCQALRTNAANAILGESASRNSAVAMHCMPKTLDPEVYLIFRALKTARRFLHRAPAGVRDDFLTLVARHTGRFQDCKGQPAP